MTRSIRRTLLFGCTVASMFLPMSANAQLSTPTAQTAPAWIGQLLAGTTDLTASSDPVSSGEELPGLGHKFELLFAMMDDRDPQNLTNGVISVLTTTAYPAGIGVALRSLPPGINIAALTNQLQLKYLFPARSCGGGSPRIQLAI